MESAATPTAIDNPQPAFSGNRRRGNRHRLNIPATLALIGEAPVKVTITELSVGGVGIQSSVALREDSVYQVDSFDTLIPPGMKVRIVSQRQAGDDGFEVGAKAL